MPAPELRTDIPLHERRIQLGDLSLYYREQGTGRPLILLHGGLATAEMMWPDAMPALARRFRVLAPDSRGHGQSDNLSGTLSYSGMADDIAGFIDVLGLVDPLVIGYSDGAQTAMELALRHPGKAAGFVFGGGVTEPYPAYVERLQRAGFTAPGVADIDTLKASFGSFFATIQAAHQVQGPEHWRELLKQISTLWLTVPAYSEAQLAAITAPALVIMGDRDELDQALRLYRHLPAGELSVIANAAHSAVELPLFWRAVDDFLDRHG